MPTSPYDDTVVILDFLGALLAQKTCSILDVGSGFGRWGFLCRCHLGYGRSLTVESRQALTIDAVERFEPNIAPIHDCVYNNVHAGDALEILPTLDTYDIVICSHALEHQEKQEGEHLPEEMV